MTTLPKLARHDWVAAQNAATEVEQVTLTGNLAYTLPAGVSPNRVHSVVFTQDATGGHTVTYGGAPLTIDPTAGASTLAEVWPGGTVTYPGGPSLAGSAATVFYGEDTTVTRPTNPNPVIWVGYTGVTPTNARPNFDMVMTFDAAIEDSFADGTGASSPVGWTNVGWNTSSVSTWNESAGYFHIVKVSPAAWATKIDGFTITGDVDVVAKMSTDVRQEGSYNCGIIVGGSGSQTQRAATVAYLRGAGYVFLSEYVNNVIQTGSEVLAPAWDAANTIVYMRLRVSGTTASVKVWKEADAEPSEWLATYTVTAKAGWIGIFSAGDRASKIYYFAASKTGTAALE